MTKDRRYKLAVYLLLLFLAIITALIAINYIDDSSPNYALLLNLATELGGVVIVFFVVDFIFLVREQRRVDDEISILRKEIVTRFSPLTSFEESKNLFSWKDYLPDASSVDIVGYNLYSLLKVIREDLVEAINRGTEVRIIIVDINSNSGKLMLQKAGNSEILQHYAEGTITFIKQMQEMINDEKKPLLQFRVTDWLPSCGMQIVKFDRKPGVALIKLHAPSFGPIPGNRRALLLDEGTNKNDFEYYSKYYDYLWDNDSYEISA